VEGFAGLADVFFEGEGGGVEDDGVVSGVGGLECLGEGVGMVGVEKDGEVEFVAQAADEGGELTGSEESALAFGGADDDGYLEFAGGGEDGFQEDEVGDVEVPNGDATLRGVVENLAEGLHEGLSLF